MASKKLTLVDIKNSNKEYEKKQRVELSDDFHVFIYPNFSPSKISELIKEVLTDRENAIQKGIDFDEINMSDWILFSIIYKFADLGIPKEITKKVQAFAQLVEYKHFGTIIEAFPQESIKNLETKLLQFKQGLELLMKENGISVEDAINELTEQENNIVE